MASPELWRGSGCGVATKLQSNGGLTSSAERKARQRTLGLAFKSSSQARENHAGRAHPQLIFRRMRSARRRADELIEWTRVCHDPYSTRAFQDANGEDDVSEA